MAGQFGGNPHFHTGQVSVATTPTRIVAASGHRLMLHLANADNATIFVGGASVSTTTGYPVLAPSSITISARDEVYGVTASGTATLSYFEESW